MKKHIFTLLTFVSFIVSGYAQEIVNGGFEIIKENKMPRNWIKDDGKGDFKIGIDSTQVHSGKYALKIDGSNIADGGKAIALAANTYGGLSAMKINTITVSAWLKTNNLKDSTIALFIQNLRGDKILRSYVKKSRASGKWQKLTIKFQTDSQTPWYGCYYGVEVSGKTTVWCDDLQLEVDGKVVKDPASLYDEPSRQTIQWLNNNLSPIKSAGITDTYEDLAPIANITDHVKIIGIGEPTHGTSDASKFKLRMLDYLVNQKGFTTLAMEEVIPVCDLMNEILLEPNPAIQDSLLSMPFYKCWKTEEMKDVFTWVNQYNQSHIKKVKFVGIDMEDIRSKNSRKRLREYGRLHNTPILRQTLIIDQHMDSLLNLSAKGMGNANTLKAAQQVRETLETMQALLLAEKANIKNQEQLYSLQSYVTVCRQWLESRFYGGKRDQFMADNLDTYVKQHPTDKVLLWAHNFHIANAEMDGEKVMGAYLKEKFGESYFPIAITAASGFYTAAEDYTQKKWKIYPFENAYRGTSEYVLNKANRDNYFLKLTGQTRKNKGNAWLDTAMKHLDIGYTYAEGEDDYKYYGNLGSIFDGIVFFKTTTASHSYLNRGNSAK